MITDHLRNAVTQRFATSMVFMSLLLGTEIGVLFSPSKPGDAFRFALRDEKYSDLNFWAGVILCVSIGMTVSTLLANFTAWAVVGSVSSQNSHTILRTSIGLYAAQLPARLVVLSIYCFLLWVVLFIYILLPNIWGIIIAIFPIVLIFHIVTIYSAFGRLVMLTKAMRQKPIFEEEEEDSMTPNLLFETLLKRALKEKDKNTPLPLYYRTRKEVTEQITLMRMQSTHMKNSNRSDEDDLGFDSQHVTKYLGKILDEEDDDEEDPVNVNDLQVSFADRDEGGILKNEGLKDYANMPQDNAALMALNY